MSMQKLKMTYHPAKKEVLFEMFGSDGAKIIIRNDSRLYKYMNHQKGKFVLQDHGDNFFEDIAIVFCGETSIDMDVVTTKSDFGDFEQMLEYYNEGHDVKINATLLAELPDMKSTYEIVKEHGENAIAILNQHKSNFYEIRSEKDVVEKDVVEKSINKFADQVNKASKLIRDKIDCMGDNNINLCFAGTYSTGKSTLINAILGYRILPEAVKSETARMFKIQSPKKDKPVKICFEIQGENSELSWNEKKNVFEFVKGPTENAARENIQNIINACNEKKQHNQMKEILQNLNVSKDVTSSITIDFPIPLDTESIQFTIYDTPGTDSNYLAHQLVLKDALSKQTHSILVFVLSPDKIEGTGNNALLSYLKDAEAKDGKTSIDIDRSLFVINKIDNINDPEQRKPLRESQIIPKKEENNDESFTINLANKKLFFTAANYALAAKASKNSVATSNDDKIIQYRYQEACNEEDGRYYKLNHVATSECATERLIKDCDSEMEKAIKDNDNLRALRIASGVYALENEISVYGEKYAGAVRAYAIIDSVNNALAMMNKEAKSLDRQNKDDINAINQEINQLKTSLKESIDQAYEKYKIKDGKLPDETVIELHLDSQYLNRNITQPTLNFVDKLLKGWFFGLGKVDAKESHKKRVKDKISNVLADYSRNFLESRQNVLERIRDDFIEEIRDLIRNNGNISDEAQKYVCEINPPPVPKATNLVDFGEIYNSNIRTGKFLFWDRDYVNKENYKTDVETKLANLTSEIASDFAKDYANGMSAILNRVKDEFELNIDTYSLKMQGLIADKEAMGKLRSKIVLAANELAKCQEKLNAAIWRVNDNA